MSRRGCFRCWLGTCRADGHADEVAARPPSTEELLAEREQAAARVKQIDVELSRRHPVPGV